MGWFSELMFGKDRAQSDFKKVIDASRKDAVDSFSIPPMPKVKPTKGSVVLPDDGVYISSLAEKDISEPVYAIVKAMKERPSTFKVEYGTSTSHTQGFVVRDVKLKQSLKVRQFYYRGVKYTFSWQWLTEDEQELLLNTFLEIKKMKMVRLLSIQRAKMKGIYK